MLSLEELLYSAFQTNIDMFPCGEFDKILDARPLFGQRSFKSDFECFTRPFEQQIEDNSWHLLDDLVEVTEKLESEALMSFKLQIFEELLTSLAIEDLEERLENGIEQIRHASSLNTPAIKNLGLVNSKTRVSSTSVTIDGNLFKKLLGIVT